MARVYLSIGSNVDPGRRVADALRALRGRFAALAVSPIYRSAAVGFDGADFLNCAAAFDWDLARDALRPWLRALEDAAGRDRGLPRYGDRTLDLDVALWCAGDACVSDLTREEFDRAHVLAPLADVAPTARDPFDGEPLAERWRRLRPLLPPLERLPSGPPRVA